MVDVNHVYQRRDEAQIVDVREPYEWVAGRIEGALHIPLNQLLAGGERGQLDQSRPVYVVCKSGNRSELASVMLRARGFDAHNVEGGMEDWAAAGYPYDAEDGSPGRVV